MHLTLVLGMGLVMIFEKVTLLLFFFVILKTIMDLRGHLKERKRFSS